MHTSIKLDAMTKKLSETPHSAESDVSATKEQLRCYNKVFLVCLAHGTISSFYKKNA